MSPAGQSSQKINRVLRRDKEDAIQYRTIANMIEREGEFIQEYLGEKADRVIQEVFSSFRREYLAIEKKPKNTEINYFYDNKEPSSEIERSSITADEIIKAIEDLNAGKEKELQIDLSELHETFEDPEYTKANISLDDVLSKKQKERKLGEGFSK